MIPRLLGPTLYRWCAGCARLLARPDVLLLLATVALFLAWPGLDLIVSGWAHEPGSGFPLGQHWLVQGIYHATEPVALTLLFGAAGAWIAARCNCTPRPRKCRRAAAYLVVVGLLGPVLLVNSVIKEYSGRARPHRVEQFDGERRYTPPLHLAAQCDDNCSFTSGHAAAGFYLMALAWAFARPVLLWVGVAAGAVVGAARIAEGDHYLSDVVFSGWVVYFVCVIVAHWWFREPRLVPRSRAVTSAADAPG